MLEGIKLSYDIADSITLANLLDARNSIQKNINKLRKLPELEIHEQENLKNDFEIMGHLTAVIKYFKG